jgi:hypothetical protein
MACCCATPPDSRKAPSTPGYLPRNATQLSIARLVISGIGSGPLRSENTSNTRSQTSFSCNVGARSFVTVLSSQLSVNWRSIWFETLRSISRSFFGLMLFCFEAAVGIGGAG